jgi:hypothetical protein
VGTLNVGGNSISAGGSSGINFTTGTGYHIYFDNNGFASQNAQSLGTSSKPWGNEYAASAILSGTITASNGVASYAPHTPVAVTVGASPFSYTNTTTTAQECYFSGGTAYSLTKMGAAVYGSLIGNSYFVLQPTNYCVLTYTVAPTLFTNAW